MKSYQYSLLLPVLKQTTLNSELQSEVDLLAHINECIKLLEASDIKSANVAIQQLEAYLSLYVIIKHQSYSPDLKPLIKALRKINQLEK